MDGIKIGSGGSWNYCYAAVSSLEALADGEWPAENERSALLRNCMPAERAGAVAFWKTSICPLPLEEVCGSRLRLDVLFATLPLEEALPGFVMRVMSCDAK